MHLPACEVKFYGIVYGGYVELLSSPYHYCCRASVTIADGVRQEELLHAGLPPVEDEVCCSNTEQHYLVRGSLMRGPNAHHNRIYSAKLHDHALVPAGALLLRRFFLGVHRTWRQELAHILGVVSLLVGFKDSGT